MSKYSSKEIQDFLKKSINSSVDVEQQVKFLRDFTPKKVTAQDLKIFTDFMLKQMPAKLKIPGCIDICGTGGSGLMRINTSTISAFILAELGIGVAKHGNKAASGRVGSFDLLEALGVDITKDGEALEKIYKKTRLAFIFARSFHPAMKFFAEARMKFGKPTIFNMLGPLLNPAGAKVQIIGTSFKGQMRMIAEACKLLGKKKVMIVCGRDGLDEVTLTGETDVVELCDGRIVEYVLKPEDFGVKRVKFEEIAGRDLVLNTKIALEILNGICNSRHSDLVFVNCALALKLVGKVKDLKEGYKMAKNAFGIGKLEAYNGNILGEIAASKILPKSKRSFFEAIGRGGNGKPVIIAEIKRASPSEGKIFKGKFDAAKIAKTYERGGAGAISVVTDKKYFQGSFEYLKEASEATALSILCKDFIIHEYQIYKAREYGANAILLIAALLDETKIKKFMDIADGLGMDCLVEVHNESELQKALNADAKIIGINNRDLTNFKIDIETTNKLIKLIPRGKLIISESGFNSREDLKKLDHRVNAVLIGTALMKAKNPKKFL